MLIDAIRKRKSVRKYLDKEIPQEIINTVMEAARLAPSTKNSQPWKFIIVKDNTLKKELVEACGNQKFIQEAPLVIVGCAINTFYTVSGDCPSYPIDLSIALAHINLQAVELGLGACWIGLFNQEKIKNILKIEKDAVVVCLMTLGYSREEETIVKGRKPLSDIICYDYFK